MSPLAERLRDAVILLPPEVDTRRKVFDFIAFEERQARQPHLELFVMAWKVDPGNPFALVLGLPKDVVHIQGAGLPIYIDPHTRWCVIRSAADAPTS